MTTRPMRQHLLLGLLTISLFASPLAEAKRLGGSRSTGMQRSTAPKQAPQAPMQQAAPAPAQTPAQQPARSGVGTALAGAAVGAAGGYMLGKAMNASGTAESQGSSFPWGWILLLGGLTIAGVMFMRRRAQAGRTAPAGYAPAAAGGANWQSQPAPQSDRVFRMGDGMGTAPAAQAITRLPDGTESAAFLRQARASFLHMQALNSPEQLEELRNYLTPEMFTSLQAEIGSNQDIAEFPELQAEMVDAGESNGQLVASARFFGKVSESLGAPAVPFSEIWHFVKLKPNDPRWVLAGIQQVN
ncbi:Tim44 domain-containing protein [Jeongeupia naejangsanensis]|uniref:Tim44 domain-containing protein n=1 Tax=Jeongeupia naejangsanensis TaxID=613195 RepID=A0ABS2BGD8_9NEIS|nr:Tim44-like domain-containing protein [Jeongeupia naejangsanensis]MBM3114677.1 Tim44 domain-containing protein [Jeongeupia naejangsanensis]